MQDVNQVFRLHRVVDYLRVGGPILLHPLLPVVAAHSGWFAILLMAKAVGRRVKLIINIIAGFERGSLFAVCVANVVDLVCNGKIKFESERGIIENLFCTNR